MPASGSEDAPFQIQMTDEALYGYARVEPERVYRRIGDLIDTLCVFPRYGMEYDPYYPAAQPAVPSRVFYCGHYGVYYCVDDDHRFVTILAVEDERRDPRNRFSYLN